MKVFPREIAFLVGGTGLLATMPAQAQDAGTTLTLPTIEIIETTPVMGPGLDQSFIPAAVNTVSGSDFEKQQSPSVVDAMLRRVPSVSIANQTGNAFEPDLQFRGFVATPLTGTPEGLAVYQNGVRINEAFGDNVHWDFIPPDAIDSMGIVTNNPIFGLNALGGAVNVRMKNGFTFHGVENDIEAGSYGRIQDSLQWGQQAGNFATYLAIDGAYDHGFRDFSASTIRRLYGDVGYKNDRSEIHLNVTAASNFFNAPASTPVGLLDRDYSSVYTTPQTDDLNMAMVSLQGSTAITDTLTLSGTAYYRYFSNHHVDGNDTDVVRCGAFLCFGDDGDPANAADGSGQLPNLFAPGDIIGEIDRNNTRTRGWGGSLQATDTAKLFGLDNTFILGGSLDMASTDFDANSELGTVNPDNFVVTGNGQFLGDSTSDEGSMGPVSLKSKNIYSSIYALDTLDLTKRFSLSMGGRLNFAKIKLEDQLESGPGTLTGTHNYFHFNPMVGGTYKITPDVVLYAGYSQSNRAPTPLELGCSDPDFPCIVDSFLVSDPDLKQVISDTFEAGVRGKVHMSGGQSLGWQLGVFRTDNSNDILNVAAPIGKSFGYFANVGDTRRQGIEASIDYDVGRWSLYASYAFVDATYQSHIQLNAPEGDPSGDDTLDVRPGDHISGIPQHHFKAGVDYRISPKWVVGGDVLAVSSQYFGGDESNQNPKLPGHAIVNLHTTYQATKNVQFHAEIQNLFNTKYSTFGTYYDTDGPVGQLVGSDNPRTETPGMPFAIYAGMRLKF